MNLNHSLISNSTGTTNLVDRLRFWSEYRDAQSAFLYLEQLNEITGLTYGELDLRARAIAGRLLAKGLKGERALLLYPPGLDFVAAFFGCLYAGVTAVPAFPPRRNRNMARVEAITDDAQAAVVLSVQEVVERSLSVLDSGDAPHLKTIPWLATDKVPNEWANEWSHVEWDEDSLAVLQYTSGSTGQPKGVMLTHANLMHNCSLITGGFEEDHESVGLSWLPTYHDMGLVGGILNPLYIGRPCILMSPMSFLQKPARWLQGISQFKATISGGPNFAYALCTEKISDEDCIGLDLSSWKVAFNGAEPVRADTLEKFTRRFEKYGFRAEAHYPCYGLAETTLIISGSERQKAPLIRDFDSKALEANRVVPLFDVCDSVRKLVSSGRILPGQKVLIVDPVTRLPLSPDRVGEIWIKSESVAQGYWNNQDETERTFHSSLASTENDNFLRTGDLGFFYEDQLFVTGRSKDLIIINGRNLYPHDIESIVENAHEAIRQGGGVAFSIEAENSEQLIIAQELVRDHRKYDPEEVAAAIRSAVLDALDVSPHSIVLLRIGKLPKTSSGKVQRHACREYFSTGCLDALAQWPPAEESMPVANSEMARNTPMDSTADITRSRSEESKSAPSIQSWLVNRIASQMKIAPTQIDVHEPFAFFGLDSIALIGISGELEAWMGCPVSPRFLFDFPAIAELSDHLARNQARDRTDAAPIPSNRESALMDRIGERRGRDRDNDAPQSMTDDCDQRASIHDLSHGQRALWFIYQMDRKSSAYNIMHAARVRADFDRSAFDRAFQTIIDRHAILRTTYLMLHRTPVQKVYPRQELKLQTVDARAWNQERLDAEIQSAADEPFDLERGPVIRVRLFELDGNRHVMLFVVHHIALDFWAFDLLFEELELHYRAEMTGIPATLPKPKADYSHFVRMQEQLLLGEEGERQWDYWQEQLGGELPLLELPTNRPRKPVQSFQGKSFHFRLTDPLTEKLISLSRSQRVTLFTTFLAAFQVLLYRYSGQEDIVVGSPTAGRDRAEFENVFGYFVNPVALRARLSDSEPFTSFLSQVRDTLTGGIMHQDYPFPLLVERLQVPRDPSRSPVFQVAIGWDKTRKLHLNPVLDANSIDESGDLDSLGLESFALGQQGAAFDLMLMVLDEGDVLSAAFQYNLDLFDESTIERMAGHFQTLLESIVDDPELPLAELPLIDNSQRRQLLVSGNETTSEYPDHSCLHDLFEKQVEQTPEAIAIEREGDRVTYRELNERANQVAHYLVGLGVGPDVLVGIYVERSIDMMIGLLGILKADGAYIPMSPGTPEERLAFMLEESQAKVVLTQQSLTIELPTGIEQVVCLDNDSPIIAKESRSNRIRMTQPSNLAYVIFTSGSTGQPKGVQIEHRSVVNFLTSMRQEPGVDLDDVLLAVTTFSFDISVLELFLPLIVGARIVMVGTEITADGLQLAQAIGDHDITFMQATPTTYRMLVEAGWQGNPRIKLLCGGESLPPDLAESLIGRCGSLWNMYGPTETTIWSAVDRVVEKSDPMPIGIPIANTQMYVLDRFLQPVPFGVAGDLYIGGDGLARDYLNRPDLTAEKFIANPFCTDPNDVHRRLYKTGDLARYRTDGRIEFLGREDFQVKIRGFRIELGEIESRLSEHPAIHHTTVVAAECKSTQEDKQLVAYFTHGDDTVNTSDLRKFLTSRLPDYMVPSLFVPLDEFPLNAAGKVDRKALPAPDASRPDLRAPYVEPRTVTERKLTEIWAKVLGLKQVGIHDNFFDLGGASMQSLEITALAGEVGIEMMPADLFKHPTIAELAGNGLPTLDAESKNPKNDDAPHASVATAKSDSPVPRISVDPKIDTKRRVKKTNIVIESIGVYLPSKAVSTADVIAHCKNKVSFPLQEMTGIESRRVAAEDEFTSDIACQAVTECLYNSRYDHEQIDLIICCHIGRDEEPDSASLEPGTAMYIKQRLGFPKAIAFDVNNACAGMFTGISIAESYLSTGAATRVMVISAEHLSPVTKTAQQEISGFIDPRIACLTLGDAGAAIILESSTNTGIGFHELELYSLAKYSQMCIGRPTAHGRGPILVVPDPIKHTSIAIENSIAHSRLILDRSPWEPEMITKVIMHQTSERSLLDGARAINKTFGQEICTRENTINNLRNRGNTASTSHFVAVWDYILNGQINAGDNVVFGITGSGQTIGTGIYTFDDLPDRIRLRQKPGETVFPDRMNGVQIKTSSEPLTRIRAASIGVLAPQSDVPVETMPMVKEVVEDCLANSEYDRSEIELVIFAGVYRTDFIFEPALAAMIADDLKINDEVKPTDAQQTFAFDVFNGGVGFLNACDIASQMIRGGKIRTALIIASEIENNRDDYPDRVMGVKETASAIILDQSESSQVGFGPFVFKYLPEELEARTVTGKYEPGNPCVYLDQDPSIEDLYLKIIPEAVNELLEREGLTIDKIDVVLPPQFSREFLDELGRVLDIERERIVDLGGESKGEGEDWLTSALPCSLHAARIQGLGEPGDIGLAINVGSGLQVGCAVYYF